MARPDPARAETGYANPVFLPDGRHFLYRAAAGGRFRAMAGSLDSRDVKQVLDDDGPAAYAPPGWLLYIRNGTLVAQAFDPDRLELGGDVVPVTATPGTASLGAGRISVSENGVLILQNNINPSYDYQLVWFDRAGKQTGALGVPGKVTVGQFPQIAPDGRRAVIQRVDPQTRNQDLWVIDLARQTFNRLTTNPALEQLPVWSSDGTHVIFSRTGVYQVAASGGEETRLMEGTRFPHDVSPGGRFLIYLERGGKTRLDVWAAPLSGSGEPHVLLNSEFDEAEPQISPDGRWLAYVSDVTGSYEVYVQAFTAEAKPVGEKIRISTGGGLHPRWRRGGKEPFYVAGTLSASDGQVMVVDWQMSGAVLESRLPKALFKTRMLPNQFQQDYDVTADGQRFLVGTLVGEASATPVSLVLNWTADVKK